MRKIPDETLIEGELLKALFYDLCRHISDCGQKHGAISSIIYLAKLKAEEYLLQLEGGMQDSGYGVLPRPCLVLRATWSDIPIWSDDLATWIGFDDLECPWCRNSQKCSYSSEFKGNALLKLAKIKRRAVSLLSRNS